MVGDSKQVRGKPKSGRTWKKPKERFSKIKNSQKKTSLVRKMEYRHEIKRVKELSKQLKLERHQENQIKKQRREQNAKRNLENERKSEVVQVIKNPEKIKHMRKSQLRQIQKRD